jgi:hypothetical protein
MRIAWLWNLARWIAINSVGKSIEQEPAVLPTREDIQALNAFYHDLSRARLTQQANDISAIDTKTNAFFTIGSTVLPIVAGFLATKDNPIQGSSVAKAMLFSGFLAYLCLAFCFVFSLRIGKWQDAPDMDQWKKISTEYAVEDLQRALGDSYADAYRANEPQIEKKAKVSAMALWTLFGEVICLSAAVLIPMWPPY